MPRQSIVVNLAPGDVRKSGSGLDLPMAVGILAASGQIPLNGLDGALFVGELALDGAVSPVRARLPISCLHARATLRSSGHGLQSTFRSRGCGRDTFRASRVFARGLPLLLRPFPSGMRRRCARRHSTLLMWWGRRSPSAPVPSLQPVSSGSSWWVRPGRARPCSPAG